MFDDSIHKIWNICLLQKIQRLKSLLYLMWVAQENSQFFMKIFNKIELYCLAQDSLDLSLNMESWFIDGTFSKVSSQIMQLYNAHGLNQGRNDINAYFLLTNKRCHTYSEVLAQIEIPINQVHFNSIMIDFE